MSIGTSKGAFYDTPLDLATGFRGDDPMEVSPGKVETDKKLQEMELSIDGFGLPISFKMPPEAPRKPADALKSSEATQVPEKVTQENIDWSKLNKPTGEMKLRDMGESPVVRQIEDFKRQASGTVPSLNDNSEEGIQTAIDVVMGAGAGIISGVKGISALGPAAKKEALTRLGHAQVLEALGEHPDATWQQTKFFRGADGRWKTEIPDANAKLKESGFNKIITQDDPRVGGETNVTYSVKPGKTVGDIFDHPELFETYPFLKNIKIGDHGNNDAIGTAFIKENKLTFRDDLDPSYLRNVLLHELQHFVQQHEGFAGGSGSKTFMNANTDRATALEKYKRVMGEVEARNVQERRDFNEVKRHYNSPMATEDRPRFLQIDPKDAAQHMNMADSPTPFRKGANDNQTYDQLSKELDGLSNKRNLSDDEFQRLLDLNKILTGLENNPPQPKK